MGFIILKMKMMINSGPFMSTKFLSKWTAHGCKEQMHNEERTQKQVYIEKQ